MTTPGRSVGRATSSFRPSARTAPVTRSCARWAAVTQGMAPSNRKRSRRDLDGRRGLAPSRRDVVRCEMPTVTKARPAPISPSQCAAVGLAPGLDQPANGCIVLRKNENRGETSGRELGVSLHEQGARAGFAAELGGKRPARRARCLRSDPRAPPAIGPRASARPSSAASRSTRRVDLCRIGIGLGPVQQFAERATHERSTTLREPSGPDRAGTDQSRDRPRRGPRNPCCGESRSPARRCRCASPRRGGSAGARSRGRRSEC